MQYIFIIFLLWKFYYKIQHDKSHTSMFEGPSQLSLHYHYDNSWVHLSDSQQHGLHRDVMSQHILSHTLQNKKNIQSLGKKLREKFLRERMSNISARNVRLIPYITSIYQ